MKVPYEWLKEYVKTDRSPDEVAESFTYLGLLLDKPIEKYISGSYETDILDLEHRMDRSDWLSILGCARDLAAFDSNKLLYPELQTEKPIKPAKNQIVDIQVLCPDIVNRFTTVVFRNVKVKDSPDWLKNRLEAYGIPSINNIVDITNYVMVELGQPMHAQDLTKMEAQEIVIRKAKAGESVTTLLGETVEVVPDAFVLTQNDKPTVIGGIVGGIKTGVDKSTTNIILDAGNYNQNTVRKVSRLLKIQNETVIRYDKFLHPNLTEIAIKRAARLILDLAGGDYYENIDWYPEKHAEKEMKIRYERVKKVSGMDIDTKRVEDILNKLGYEIILADEEGFYVKVPYFRTDVEVEDDIVSDVLRIGNYQNIPITSISETPPKEITPPIYKFEDELKDICVKLGLHEHITEPLVKRGESNPNQIMLENALSSEQNALRTTLYETLAPVLNIYTKHKISDIGVFEIGKFYTKETHNKSEKYNEIRVLEVVYKNSTNDPKIISQRVKTYLSTILYELGISGFVQSKSNENTEILFNKDLIGYLKYDSLTLFTEKLLKYKRQNDRVLSDFRNYKTEDLSLSIKKHRPIGPIIDKITNMDTDILGIELAETYIGDNVEKGEKGILLRVTHNSQKFDKLRDKIKTVLQEEFDIEFR
ncbi:phenylalanine--tRNA ligase subunit beta [Patescibacteria group bacterium]|nr:phenylalanine--tRNA ligase subunit beta [Patescibacteria group bacterium]